MTSFGAFPVDKFAKAPQQLIPDPLWDDLYKARLEAKDLGSATSAKQKKLLTPAVWPDNLSLERIQNENN